jgi:hypothetical protein
MVFAPNGRELVDDGPTVTGIEELIAAEERCLAIERLYPHPRYLFCSALTVESMSEAADSFARVTMAEIDLRSVGDWLEGRRIFTLSTDNTDGMSDLIAEGEVPGGSEAR